jgi:DNA end-binding protein Ku
VHIVASKAADFESEKFEEDHYEETFTELINVKRNGKTIGNKSRPNGANVLDLMEALKKSISGRQERGSRKRGAKG